MSKKNIINPYWLKMGSMSFIERASMMIFGFFSFIILIRALNKSEFGVWVLFITVTTIIELVRNGLVRTPTIRYIKDRSNDPGIIQCSSFIINLGFSIIVAVLIVFFAGFLETLWNAAYLKEMLFLYLILNFIMMLSSHLETIQHSYQNFKLSFINNFVNKGLFFFIILFLYLIGREISLLFLVKVQILVLLLFYRCSLPGNISNNSL